MLHMVIMTLLFSSATLSTHIGGQGMRNKIHAAEPGQNSVRLHSFQNPHPTGLGFKKERKKRYLKNLYFIFIDEIAQHQAPQAL